MKKQLKVEDVYNLVPYYVIEDAGLPLNCLDLSTGQADFLNELIRFAIDEYESDYNIEQFTEDLQMIKGDLEAVLNELAK
tara:strand:+ start:7598 stop:7837 length:240 start_codon:yes stop_codon:yes gene_type:complete